MTLQELLTQLSPITGPLGPMVEPEERIASQENWLNQLTQEDLPALQQLVAFEDYAAIPERHDWEEVKDLACDGILVLTADNPKAAKKIWEGLLQETHNAPRILDNISAWGHPDASEIIRPLIADPQALSTTQIISLLWAIGEIQGKEAEKALSVFSGQYALNQEILNAIQNIRKKIRIAGDLQM